MEKRNWIELSHTLVERYKIYSLYTAIKSLPLQIFFTAVSAFSGPIALLLDKSINHQFTLPENYMNAIIILNCKGEFIKTISYNYKDRIIFMGFTKIEQLLIIQASGDYWLIDAFSGQIKNGNYTYTNQKQEKYRGCQLLQSNKLILIRQKQLGFTQNPTSNWQPLPQLKIKFQNPIFCSVYNSSDQFIYLSKLNSIQMYNLSFNRKTTIYTDSYLNQKWQNLLAISFNKQKNLLGLVFCNPSVIFYIDLTTNNHKRLDAMIQLKYDLSSSNTSGLTSKYLSKSAYKPSCYTLSWLDGRYTLQNDLQELEASILVFGNPKLLVMYDGNSTRLTPRSNCNQLISVQKDCIRVYNQDSHQIYRIVPYLFQTIIEIGKINEGYYKQQFRKIIQLHDEYTNYIQKDMIDLSKFNSLWKMANRSQPDKKNKSIQIQQQNGQDNPLFNSNFYLNKQNTQQTDQKIKNVQDTIIRPLIKSVRCCIDPVDQVKMLKFIFFIKNLYNSPIDIYELCEQMRVINNLKFQFLSRTLTLNQFEYLKYDAIQNFLTILLRYKMHFIADTIFKDSQSKYKIFLHWAKCKIQKNSQSIAFEQIKQKYFNMPKKHRNSKVFTDITKYSLDRGKLGLAQKIIQLDQNPERKIMVYLLMMTSTTDKKIVQRLINAAQQSSRSFLIYRVIRQLLQSTWIQNHSWVNILYNKPNVARHYLRYLKMHGKQQFIRNYFFQNKQYDNYLSYYGVERMFELTKGQQYQIPQFSQESVNIFVSKMEELKKIVPNMNSIVKFYSKNQQMDLLRKVKTNGYVPSEDELKQVKNDVVLQYIGQILFQKQKVESAVTALKKIRSDKVYNILMRKQLFKDAIDLAFQRKNKQAIQQIKLKCPQPLQQLINQKMAMLNKK